MVKSLDLTWEKGHWNKLFRLVNNEDALPMKSFLNLYLTIFIATQPNYHIAVGASKHHKPGPYSLTMPTRHNAYFRLVYLFISLLPKADIIGFFYIFLCIGFPLFFTYLLHTSTKVRMPKSKKYIILFIFIAHYQTGNIYRLLSFVRLLITSTEISCSR